MSQFGFFNTPQPQPQLTRAGYDAVPASHSAFDAPPRRYEDPYARAPSPPRGAGFFGSSGGYPTGGPMDRLSGPMDRAYPAPAHYAESSIPMDRGGAYLDAPRAMAPIHYETGRDPYATPIHYETRDPYPAPIRYETGRDAFPASWRSEPPREERHEFFGNTDTWRSARPRSPPRDRIYNADAFGSQRGYSPPFKRPQYSKDRSPPRRENRARGRSRWDDNPKRDVREKSNERERKRERSRSRDRKKDRKEEKPEKRPDLNWRAKGEKENGTTNKENGEKKKRVDDKKKETIEESKKEAENIEPEAEKVVEAKDEPVNNDEEITEVTQEDEYEEEKGIVEIIEPKKEDKVEKVEEKTRDEKKEGEKKRQEKKEEEKSRHEKKEEEKARSEKKDDRQSRIRSPSLEKRRHDRSGHRASSAEKRRVDRPRYRSPSPVKRKDDEEFKVLVDASFDEIHRPGARPYGTIYGERREDYRPEAPKPEAPRERGASWAEQYKAKVMITKTAVHGLGGAPGAAPSSVAVAPAAMLPPVTPAPLPPLPPRAAAYDPYDPYGSAAAARQSASLAVYAERALSEYPRAHPTELAEYTRRMLASPAVRALDAHPRVESLHPYDERPGRAMIRDERDLYEQRRRLVEEHGRSRSPPPPPRRPEMYEYERRLEEGRLPPPPPRDYYEERYRARYADAARDEYARYAERAGAPYETAMSAERERRSSHHDRHRSRSPIDRSPRRSSSDRHHRLSPSSASSHHHHRHAALASPPSPKPVIEEIDASKLVEPLEDDGWDDVARMLSPEKVVVEKKAKKPLLAAAPPPPQPVPPPAHLAHLQQHAAAQHRPIPRDSPPVGGFFSQPVPSVRPKIAFADSQPFYKEKLAAASSSHRPAFFATPGADGHASAGYAPPPPASDAYSRAISYEDLASSNGAATYRGGPAPGWGRDGRRY